MSGLLLAVQGCSSRGSAPVYSRFPSEPPVQTKLVKPRPAFGPTHTYYLVQKGDTLYSIAWRNNLEYQQLAWWNGIRPPAYQIFPGQRLRLKAPESRQRPSSRTRSLPPPAPPSTPPSQNVAKPPPHIAKPPQHVAKKPAAAVQRSHPAEPARHLKLSWVWPTKGKVVQTFAHGDDNRKGIWIHGTMGQPVTASEAGKVVYAGNGLVGYGNLIIIKHDRAYLSAYGYNSKLLVREGDRVKKGDLLAQMGSPNSGGQPVLHFEIRREGKPVNPLPLLPQR